MMKWVWIAFLVVVLVVFGVFESYAIYTGQQTLSAFVWATSKAWPPLPAIVGYVAGFLTCHFWWTNDDPAKSSKR